MHTKTPTYLLHRVHTVRSGETILVHAAGGVGLFLCQWGKYLGARVIGTVGSEEKAQSAKSLRVSRPVLFHYIADPVRLRAMAANVFTMLERDVLKVNVRHRYPLASAASALDALESRRTIGSIVLVA